MKPLTTLIFLMFVLGSAYGQDHKSPSKKIQIGINYSADLNYRTLFIKKETHGSLIVKDSRNKNEIPKYGYTTGILLSINICPKISLTTGLQYSNKGYQTKTTEAIWQAPDPSLASSTQFRYQYYYIDIPFIANYFIGNKKLRLVTSVGLTTNLFINEIVSLKLNYLTKPAEIHNTKSNYNYNKFNTSATLGCGMNYRIHSKIEIRLEPAFRYQILRIINADLTARLWNIGLNLGVFNTF